MSKMRKGADVVVVGGGIVGCAVARAVAARGASVLIVDRDRPAREATWAAGGMLSPLGESHDPGPFLALGLESLRRYPAFVEGIREESGEPVELVRSGKLQLALDQPSETRLRRQMRWMRDRQLSVRWLDREEIREREPVLAGPLRGGLFLECEGQVDNRLLGEAAVAAAIARGARLAAGTHVEGILQDGGRVAGVEVEGGERIPAGRVLIAAGAWSGRLRGLPRRLPVRPVRGQMVSVAPDPSGPSTIVDTSRVYMIPRKNGPLVLGSTMEEEGFRKETTESAISSMVGAAVAVAPGLAEADRLETWSGLRPGTPDDLPILGEDPDLPGLFYATGHFRNGILLAPITAACLAPLLVGDDSPPVTLHPFRPDRF